MQAKPVHMQIIVSAIMIFRAITRILFYFSLINHFCSLITCPSSVASSCVSFITIYLSLVTTYLVSIGFYLLPITLFMLLITVGFYTFNLIKLRICFFVVNSKYRWKHCNFYKVWSNHYRGACRTFQTSI